MADMTFRIQYQSGHRTDMRTFSAFLCCDDGELEIYKFYHPVTGMNIGLTTFSRRNLSTNIFEPAGEIEWLSHQNATIHFGIEQVSIHDLRKVKNNSQSRRFKVAGAIYKWKIGGNNTDLYCIDSRDRTIATWTQNQLQLRVSARAEEVLDRLFVTLLLNLWIKHIGEW